MAKSKPLVSVACICEKVLREGDGVLSAIRIIPAAEMNALVILKAGEFNGRGTITFGVRSPGGKASPAQTESAGAPPSSPQ